MNMDLQEYMNAIRQRVCSVCIDAVCHGDEFVRCALPIDRACPVEEHLPQIVDVVTRVNSHLMADYEKALRETVCAICEQSDADFCVLRSQADCPLDRYFMLIAEAIYEVRQKQQALTETAGIP